MNRNKKGTYCFYVLETEGHCSNDSKWLPFGSHLEAHFARGESAYLVLQIQVDGFRTHNTESEGESGTVGQLKLEFETQCESFCQLVLLSVSS